MKTITELYTEFTRLLSEIEAIPGDIPGDVWDRPFKLARRIVRLPCVTAHEATLKVRIAVWSTTHYIGSLEDMGIQSDRQDEEIDALMSFRDQLVALFKQPANTPLYQALKASFGATRGRR
jgi:hypothetical protein